MVLVPQSVLNQHDKIVVDRLQQTHPDKLFLLKSCKQQTADKVCKLNSKEVMYSDALMDATFCLILKNGEFLSNPALVRTVFNKYQVINV